MKDENSGCGANGRDFSSGWNCTPMNQGWSSSSMISGNCPSGDMPEKRMPCFASAVLVSDIDLVAVAVTLGDLVAP